METNQTGTLILRDQAGEYYLLPRAVLEQGRVSAEARVAIEEQFPALQAIGTPGDDTQGHVVPIVAGAIYGVSAAAGGILLGCGLYYGATSNLGPLIRAYAAGYE